MAPMKIEQDAKRRGAAAPKLAPLPESKRPFAPRQRTPTPDISSPLDDLPVEGGESSPIIQKNRAEKKGFGFGQSHPVVAEASAASPPRAVEARRGGGKGSGSEDEARELEFTC
jgi:hypothetical protein